MFNKQFRFQIDTRKSPRPFVLSDEDKCFFAVTSSNTDTISWRKRNTLSLKGCLLYVCVPPLKPIITKGLLRLGYGPCAFVALGLPGDSLRLSVAKLHTAYFRVASGLWRPFVDVPCASLPGLPARFGDKRWATRGGKSNLSNSTEKYATTFE